MQKRKALGKRALPAKANTSLNRKGSTNPRGCCTHRISAAEDTGCSADKASPLMLAGHVNQVTYTSCKNGHKTVC